VAKTSPEGTETTIEKGSEKGREKQNLGKWKRRQKPNLDSSVQEVKNVGASIK